MNRKYRDMYHTAWDETGGFREFSYAGILKCCDSNGDGDAIGSEVAARLLLCGGVSGKMFGNQDEFNAQAIYVSCAWTGSVKGLF